MQLSTYNHDYIIDVLELRDHISIVVMLTPVSISWLEDQVSYWGVGLVIEK